MSVGGGATAILSALAEEQQGLVAHMQNPLRTRHAGRDYWYGLLHGKPVVLALSRIGKVAAATTAAALIEKFGVARVVFTGVAGGVGVGVRVGDAVLASAFLQHDMDASPLFPRFEIPLYGQTCFPADAGLTALLLQASQTALARMKPMVLVPHKPAVHMGLIASGDRFVSGAAEAARLLAALQASGHQPLAVEMEGAAVAQVCADYGVPFAAVRTISDRADDTAHVDFPRFVADVASVYACDIMDALLQLL